MNIKKILIVILVVMVGLFGQGCGASDDYEEEVVNNIEEDENEEEYEEEVEDDLEEQGDYIRVGSYDTGYVNLPSDWIMMNSVNPNAADHQYCNPEQTFMINLVIGDDGGIDPETTSEKFVEDRKEEGESQAGRGEILGYPAYQAFTNMDDGSDELVWFFQVEEGYMQMIQIQGLSGEMQFLMDLVNDTFSFEE